MDLFVTKVEEVDPPARFQSAVEVTATSLEGAELKFFVATPMQPRVGDKITVTLDPES
jgi:hypothetical protein